MSVKLETMPTSETMGANLAAMVRSGSEEELDLGLNWYPIRARRHVVLGWAKLLDLPPHVVAGVVAAFQSNDSWQAALDKAWRLLCAYAAGELKRRPRVGGPLRLGLGDSIRKAWAILQGGAPLENLGSKRKIPAFYQNLMGDYSIITIDRWAERAAGAPEGSREWSGGYDRIAEAYRLASDELGGTLTGFTPAAVQAICWIIVRGSAA